MQEVLDCSRILTTEELIEVVSNGDLWKPVNASYSVKLAVLPGAVFMTVVGEDFFQPTHVCEARISSDGKTLSLQPDGVWSVTGIVVLSMVFPRPD